MFWIKNKIPFRFQLIYTIIFVVYFAIWGGFKFKIEVLFFILAIAIIASSIQYSYLYFAEKGLVKLGISNNRSIYLLAFIGLYLLNIGGMLLFTPVGWNGGKSYVFFYGFYGVPSLLFVFLLMSPLNQILLKK